MLIPNLLKTPAGHRGAAMLALGHLTVRACLERWSHKDRCGNLEGGNLKRGWPFLNQIQGAQRRLCGVLPAHLKVLGSRRHLWSDPYATQPGGSPKPQGPGEATPNPATEANRIRFPSRPEYQKTNTLVSM